jgi:hypothetical protein
MRAATLTLGLLAAALIAGAAPADAGPSARRSPGAHPELAPPAPAAKAPARAAPPRSVAPTPSVERAERDRDRGREVILVPYFHYHDPFYYDPFYYHWYGRWPYDPWWYGPPAPAYRYEVAVPADRALVTVHVKPSKATVLVDGRVVGEARDFDEPEEPLWLKPGRHVVELRRSGYQTLRLAFDLSGGEAYDLRYKLAKGEGLDARSSEATPASAAGA